MDREGLSQMLQRFDQEIKEGSAAATAEQEWQDDMAARRAAAVRQIQEIIDSLRDIVYLALPEGAEKEEIPALARISLGPHHSSEFGAGTVVAEVTPIAWPDAASNAQMVSAPELSSAGGVIVRFVFEHSDDRTLSEVGREDYTVPPGLLTDPYPLMDEESLAGVEQEIDRVCQTGRATVGLLVAAAGNSAFNGDIAPRFAEYAA